MYSSHKDIQAICMEMLTRLSDALRHRTLLLTAAAVCTLFAASCAGEEDDIPEEGTVGEVWLSVKLQEMAPGKSIPVARAAGAPADPDGHPDEEGIEAENYIDVDDMSIMLFDADSKLVAVFGANEYEVTRESSGIYSLLLKTTTDRFEFASGGSGDMTFTMMILTNLHGTGDGDGAFPLTYLLNTPQALSQTHRGFGYTGIADGNPWTPSIADGRLIPMAGTVTATISEDALKAGNSPDNAVPLPVIYMQRAMAQVRLIDAVANDNFKITGMTLHGCAARGAYLPELSANSGWMYNTEVLEYATSGTDWYDTDFKLPSQPITYANTRGDSGVMIAGKSYDGFRIYVPEYDRTAAYGKTAPTLEIFVYDKTSGETLTFTYTFPSADGTGYTDFVRNHIYEVIVSDIKVESEISLKFTYGICPWVTPPAIDIPSFDRPGDRTPSTSKCILWTLH